MPLYLLGFLCLRFCSPFRYRESFLILQLNLERSGSGHRPPSGDDGIRTHDPLLAGQVLSQLSYTPIWFLCGSVSSLLNDLSLPVASALPFVTVNLSSLLNQGCAQVTAKTPRRGSLKIEQQLLCTFFHSYQMNSCFIHLQFSLERR